MDSAWPWEVSILSLPCSNDLIHLPSVMILVSSCFSGTLKPVPVGTSVGSWGGPERMCTVDMDRTMLRTKFSDPQTWQSLPLDEVQRDGKAFLWSKCECWQCVQVITKNWPVWAKTDNCGFLLQYDYKLRLFHYETSCRGSQLLLFPLHTINTRKFRAGIYLVHSIRAGPVHGDGNTFL